MIAGETDKELRIAFDFDGIVDGCGEEHKDEPVREGPLASFAKKIAELQSDLKKNGSEIKITTAVITARDALSLKRAIKTLRHYGIGIDKLMFLGGLDKEPFIKVFSPHIFFDGQVKWATLEVLR